MSVRDRSMLSDCIKGAGIDSLKSIPCKEHPLDTDIVDALAKLRDAIKNNDDDYEIFDHRSEVDSLWRELLKKAIKCLRYYDKREPFHDSSENKRPIAYGVDSLNQYYIEYGEFERILYGSSQYYRDHVIHVFRTWLTGIHLLTRNNGQYLEKIQIHDAQPVLLEAPEKISIWTLIALTHDLGYPLQKAKSIIDQIKKMVSTFVANPEVWVDFSFHGVQNNMNDFILRLMSSKMVKKHLEDQEKTDYVVRLQPKYYFKFQKSLEKNDHGILSTLIIYKMLTYFLESDYTINEDYKFVEEERRQFYIRREILRAIAAHTCNDIYQMYITSFSVLLRICDDTQEWGRKNLSELYVASKHSYELKDIELDFESSETSKCIISERIKLDDQKDGDEAGYIDVNALKDQIHQFRRQALVYIMIFRDGQDTKNRDFSFIKQLVVECGTVTTTLKLEILKDCASKLTGHIKYSSNKGRKARNKQLGESFFRDIKYLKPDPPHGQDGQEVAETAPSKWRTREFNILLMD